MDLKDMKLSSVKYKINTFTITAGSTTLDVPQSQIGAMKIEKNFEYENFPFVYVAVNVPGWVYFEIIKNSDNVKVTMDMHSIVYRKDFDENITSSSKSEFKGRYVADIAIDTPVFSEVIQKEFEQMNGSYKKSYTFNEYYLVEMALQNEAYFKAKSTVVNAVLQTTNMTSNVAFLCKKAGISNVLMSPLSNRKSYSEFVIPPVNAVDQLKNWSVNYGFHTAGTVLFFDLDRAYIINKMIACTAWRQNEYKNVHVMSLNQYNNGIASTSGYFMNSKEKYHLLHIPPNNIQTTSMKTLPVPGSSAKMETIMFNTDCATFESLTPNKLYIVDIQTPSTSKNLNGKYRLLRYSVDFEPSGDVLTAKFNITLAK